MGIKYHYDVKDQQQARRFQHLQARTEPPPAPTPGQRAPKKLTRKQAARLAAKPTGERA